MYVLATYEGNIATFAGFISFIKIEYAKTQIHNHNEIYYFKHKEI